ncbi:SWR1-complex protein 5 [Coleophoma crateriformis]|uniref:SWR1-complex protein 5 n=1 Tax=Coleophoma crateriformis TaxID=565419 RepID=A0A3D8RWS7_9HELO|nr:SWR1-complex protein 5 [Coleophoma crateriformis]
MPPELIPDDDEYASSEDSDFAPEAALAEASQDSGSESEADDTTTANKTTVKTKRRHSPDKEADDAGFENSGDEAIIERGLKKQKKKGKKGKEDLEDEGGEGGLVKTRSMRAQEKGEKKILVDTSKATIDVDAVWASMISGKPATTTTSEVLPITESKSQSPILEKGQTIEPSDGRLASRETSTLSDGPDSMIMIKRTYKFAGKVHTEQKLVSRNSAEAKLYLASQKDNPSAEVQPDSLFTKSKRPTKLARRSIFEPITEALPQRKDLHFGARKSDGAMLSSVNNKDAKKLTTVEKSAMDWAGFVDKEGIADELDAAGKAKGAFRDRQEFLARVEGKREEEARRARLAGK